MNSLLDVRAWLDLYAQTQMANYAFWALVISAVGTIISVFGLGAVVASLGRTRRAITDNRELGEAAVRAFVEVQAIEIASDGKAMLIDLVNVGQTPAVAIHIRIDLEAVDIDDIARSVELKTWLNMKMLDGAGTGEYGKRTVRVEPAAGVEIIPAFARNGAPEHLCCMVNGRVHYQDIFGKWWLTGFAFYAKPGGRFLKPVHSLPVHRAFEDKPPRKTSWFSRFFHHGSTLESRNSGV